jgi:putative NADH-flavin reductase
MSESNEKKKILVVGGTGRVGQEVIKSALKQGHEVRAITRNMKKAKKFEEGNVEWQECDATNKVCMLDAIDGRDAVISSIGPDGTGKTTVYSDSVQVMVDVMKQKKVKRLVVTSCDWEYPHTSWVFKNIVKWHLKNLQDDTHIMERFLGLRPRDSIQWTVVRAFHLVAKPFTGKYRTGLSNIDPPFVTHTRIPDLGDFLVKEAFDSRWVHNYVTIGY